MLGNLLAVVKARPITIAGLIILVIGLGAPSVLATLNIDTVPPIVWSCYPLGTTSTPTSLTPSTSYRIYLVVSEKVPEAWVLIDGVRKNLPTEEYVSYEHGLVSGWEYSTTWTSPAYSETYIKFEFCAKDSSGNVGSKTGYAIMGTPAGDFYINNHGPLNEKSVLSLNTRDIVFKCVPTDYVAQIDRVYVKISGDTSVPWLDLTKQSSGEWTTSWTAPKDGSYTVNGYVCAGDFGYQMMSLTVGIPNPIFPSVETILDYCPWIGIALIVVGLITKH